MKLAIIGSRKLDVQNIGDYIPEGVTEIGGGCFEGLRIKSIVIPGSINKISSCAFGGCSKLHSVYINDVSKWCNIDFEDAEANPLYNSPILFLKGEPVIQLEIPEDVKVIKNFAFYGCKGMGLAEIPKSLVEIGKQAFFSCSGIKRISSYQIRKIGAGAFASCSGIDTVSLDSYVELGSHAFSECENIWFAPDDLKNTKGTYAFEHYWRAKGLCPACGGKCMNLLLVKKCKKCGQLV